MLSATASSRVPPRAKVLQAAGTPAMASRALLLASPASSALPASPAQQQIRSFRFGRLSTYINSVRPRRPRYRYMDVISRKLSWDQSSSSADYKTTIKKVMARSGRPGSNRIMTWSGDLEGGRPGHNIEDVERTAINDLFHSNSEAQRQAAATTPKGDLRRAPLEDVRESLASERTNRAESHSQQTQPRAASAEEFVAIDPITNRRIPSGSEPESFATAASSTDAHADPMVSSRTYAKLFGKHNATQRDSITTTSPATDGFVSSQTLSKLLRNGSASFSDAVAPADQLAKYQDTSRSHFSLPDVLGDIARQPVYSDGGPSAEELRKYSNVIIDPEPWVQPDQQVASYDDLSQYKPVMNAELDAKAFGWSIHQDSRPRESGDPPRAAETSTLHYKVFSADSGPIQWRQLNGLPRMSADQGSNGSDGNGSKEYRDLGEYRPVQWNEPDGARELTPEEKSKEYEDLDKYGPTRWNEPDGLPELTPEEKSKQYEDLDKYDKPVRWNEPDGLPELTPEEKSKKYKDLNKYKSVQWNEPDGKLAPTAEELSKNYEDLHLYGPIIFNEGSDGKMPPTSEELSKRYDDLHTYRPVEYNEPDGKTSTAHETTVKDYGKLFQLLQRDQSEKANAPVCSSDLENSVQFDGEGKYKPTRWNEPDGLPELTPEEKSKQYEDLDKYEKPVEWNEPDGLPELTPEEKSKKYEDLDKYDKPVRWNEPDGKPAPTAEEKSKQYKDLGQYRAVRWNEPDGLPALSPEELSKRYSDLHTYKGPDAAQLKAMEEELAKFERDWDNSQKAARTTVKQSKIKASNNSSTNKLTGNYARDFPEDFAVNWTPLLGQQSSPPPEQGQEKPESEISSLDESFPKLQPAVDRKVIDADEALSRLEPALDRTQARSTTEAFSTEPHGLEASYKEECGGATAPSFVRTYGTVSDANAPPSRSENDGESNSAPVEQAPPEPSLYKIVAFDPATRSISIADTSSTITDTSDSLAPPEALTRLTNPAKFLPHLGPLQAQGYDIVSSSGDMLVFRKVREAQQPAHHHHQHAGYQPTGVNPIDMMGSQPITPQSYAASPTGYVTYDDDYTAGTEDTKPLPPHRRPSSGSEPGPEKAPARPARGRKILLGAATVGGLSYALGVVGEFFKTGGGDGKGPTTRF